MLEEWNDGRKTFESLGDDLLAILPVLQYSIIPVFG
jgi:hypothetical protein